MVRSSWVMGCWFGMPRKLMLGKRPLAKIRLSILILYDFPALPSLKPSMNKQYKCRVQWEKTSHVRRHIKVVFSIQLARIGGKIQWHKFCSQLRPWFVYHILTDSENFGQNLKAIIRQYKSRNNGKRSDP